MATTQAQSPDWTATRVNVEVEERDISELLNLFASQRDLGIEIDPEVTGLVSGRFTAIEPLDFLNGLAETFGFCWFFDGRRLFVEAKKKYRNEMIQAENIEADELRNAIESLGFASGPSTLEHEIDQADGLIRLSGAPRFLMLAQSIVEELDAREAERQLDEMDVRTFKLKYAYADDVQVSGGDNISIIPGVARILQNVMTGGNTSPLSTGPLQFNRRSGPTGLRGLGLAALNVEEPILPARAPFETANAEVAEEMIALESPVVQADPRTNSIIVRDLASRLPLYEKIIRMLDSPTRIIEISVAIIDLELNNETEIGVEYGGFVRAGDARLGATFLTDSRRDDPEQATSTDVISQTLNLIGGGSGFTASALIINNAYELLARVRLLEARGIVNIISSPAVLTMENVQATFQQDETVYVRVAGREEVDLFDINVGVQLQVTPSVFVENGQTNIQMLLDIRDGNFLEQEVDEIPTTRQSVITTQATVPHNKSLLIGGYVIDRWSDTTTQVPVVGDIPVLGYLFKNEAKSKRRSQRFFFITPRVVNLQVESEPMGGDGKTEIRRALPVHRIEALEAKRRLVHPTTASPLRAEFQSEAPFELWRPSTWSNAP